MRQRMTDYDKLATPAERTLAEQIAEARGWTYRDETKIYEVPAPDRGTWKTIGLGGDVWFTTQDTPPDAYFIGPDEFNPENSPAQWAVLFEEMKGGVFWDSFRGCWSAHSGAQPNSEAPTIGTAVCHAWLAWKKEQQHEAAAGHGRERWEAQE